MDLFSKDHKKFAKASPTDEFTPKPVNYEGWRLPVVTRLAIMALFVVPFVAIGFLIKIPAMMFVGVLLGIVALRIVDLTHRPRNDSDAPKRTFD